MFRRIATLLFALAACTRQAATAGPAEAQLATDLPAPVVDTMLTAIAQTGGPRAERIQGASLGAAALTDAKGSQQGGDVRWDAEPYGAIAAARQGDLIPMLPIGNDVPPLWRDRDGLWIAVGGRAVVLLIATDLLENHPVPNYYAALTQPWLKGKVAIAAPTGGSSLPNFAALFRAWGEARTQSWMTQLRANAVQVLESDGDVRQAVVTGKAVVGMLASDEAAKAAASAAHVDIQYPNQASIGTFVWPTAVSRPKNPPHPAASGRLAARLASLDVEQLLVARVPGYLPLRTGIPVPPGVTSAANLRVVSVEPAVIVEEITRRKAELAEWTTAVRRDIAKR